MPVYEYQCKKCGHIFDREHPIGEKHNYKCPDCSCASTKKIISSVGVIFKGNGFYVTDNRNSNGTPAAKTTKTAPGKTASGNGSSTKSSESDSTVTSETTQASEN